MSYNKETQRAYYLKNKEKIKERQRIYYFANKDKIGDYKKQYAELNREKYRRSSSQWNKRNPRVCKRSREKWRKYKNAVKEHNGCLNPRCEWKGEYDASMLDFHHTGSDKSFTISKTTTSMAKLKSEISKCTVVCANCHRLITRYKLKSDDFKPMQVLPE